MPKAFVSALEATARIIGLGMTDPRRATLWPWFVRRLKAVLAVYVVAAALMPLTHHDIVCHAKSATHCASCVIASSAEAAGDSALLAPLHLAHTGDAIVRGQSVPQPASLSSIAERAPPSCR